MANVARLSLPLAMVATLIVSAIGAGVTYGATVSRLSALEETSKKVEGLQAEIRTQREWRARIDTHLEYLSRGIDRLEQRLGTR